LPVALCLVACTPGARAHFLFIRIGQQAEGGRFADVYFSDRAEAGDPQFVSRIAHTRLWSQIQPGQFRELSVHQAADRLRAPLPTERALSIVGECQYGVISRANQTPFLLRYYPKAVSGTAAELNRMSPRPEIPFEIHPTFDIDSQGRAGSRIRLVALRNGKVVPGAIFIAVDSDLSEETITAGADGAAVWNPRAPGHYAVYVRETQKTAGDLGGKHYEEIREFATLSLGWPLECSGVDPEAIALFNDAVAHRAAWFNFPGFTADVSGSVDGRPYSGKVAVSRSGAIDLEVDDPVARDWLQDQLDSLITHRMAPPPADAATAQSGPRLRFGEENHEHPLGRLLMVEGDRMGSSYRVKDHQLTVVNRRMGKSNMTITIVENETTPEGRFLPHSYVVQYWDAETGRLRSSEIVQERWQRAGSLDLPAQHSVTKASENGLSVRTARFTNAKPRKDR
jgi:hypothetical protein